MGNGEHRPIDRLIVDNGIIVEQQIEIDRAWPPPLATFPMQRVFHSRQHAEHFMGAQVGFDQAGTVEKRRLTDRPSDGACFPEAADFLQRHSGHESQQFNGPVELFSPQPLI